MSETADEKRMKLRYAGACRLCEAELPARVDALYERSTKTVRCLDCSPADPPPSVVEEGVLHPSRNPDPVDVGTPGASARREYERRQARREARIRGKHPKLGGLILTMSDDPQSTTAWNTGALGEERLGQRLNELSSDTMRVLHDRRIPGTRANIDHIAVTPTGVYVIDAKKYKGRPWCGPDLSTPPMRGESLVTESEREPSPASFDVNEPPWLGPTAEVALRAVIPTSMEDTSAALYARWWQLECWLRSLAYVELRALHGTRWIDAVKAANFRLEQDAVYTHMAGPDSDNPLAYLDYSQIVELIDRFWDQIGYALLEKASWQGRQVELKRIRHRIGHMRRPHADDLGRLEQLLRDLEGGTFRALSTYNDRRYPDGDAYSDAVTQGWIRGEHEDAQRLLAHADRQYETRVRVSTSARTWAERRPASIAGTSGYLWHVDFFKRGQGIDVPALWRDVERGDVGRLLLHLEAHGSHHVGFTFCAVDDDTEIADAIGSAFDYVLTNLAYGHGEDQGDAWSRRMRGMDYRIVSGDGWTVVDETTVPISNFGAGGGVTRRPRG